MKTKRILLHIISMLLLMLPNSIYLACNLDKLTETHAIALTMVALVVLSIVGLGVLCHFKLKACVWIIAIGAFILALSNISYVAGIALIIEGIGLTLDAYVVKPLIVDAKTKELKARGESITYTRRID